MSQYVTYVCVLKCVEWILEFASDIHLSVPPVESCRLVPFCATSFQIAGALTFESGTGLYRLDWFNTTRLESTLSVKNRSMELSELVRYEGRLFAFCILAWQQARYKVKQLAFSGRHPKIVKKHLKRHNERDPKGIKRGQMSVVGLTVGCVPQERVLRLCSYSALQCITVHYSALQCITVHRK